MKLMMIKQLSKVVQSQCKRLVGQNYLLLEYLFILRPRTRLIIKIGCSTRITQTFYTKMSYLQRRIIKLGYVVQNWIGLGSKHFGTIIVCLFFIKNTIENEMLPFFRSSTPPYTNTLKPRDQIRLPPHNQQYSDNFPSKKRQSGPPSGIQQAQPQSKKYSASFFPLFASFYGFPLYQRSSSILRIYRPEIPNFNIILMCEQSEVFFVIKNYRSLRFNKKVCFRKWTPEENDIFARKLEENLEVMKDRELRKKIRIFRLISNSIPTKNSKQVKSHHQKLMLRHKSLENIIRCYKKENDDIVKIENSEMDYSESEVVKQENDSLESNQYAVKQEMGASDVVGPFEVQMDLPQQQFWYYYYY